MDEPDLVPLPRSVADGGGRLALDARTALDAGPGTERAAHWLRTALGAATGLPLPPAADGGVHGGDHGGGHGGVHGGAVVRLRVDEAVAAELGPEGYRLSVTGGGAEIRGGAAPGVFWGAQTLRQLLGPDAYRRAPLPGRGWSLPYVRVADAPRFAWRGFMLDTARHFTPRDGVLRWIDLLAAHKLNVLHLHLTDDQGWRLEIERFPRLTEVGAWRRRTRLGHRDSPLWDERPHGGFYTHDDVREIVAYAAERHITVVPEIDVPGHSQAAIAAYPELGNTDIHGGAADAAAPQVWDDWGVSPNVLAPTEAVLRFYEGVFEEVLELFPGEFVHIGGDECPRDQWRRSPAARARAAELGLDGVDALQAWFVRHFDRFLAERGRRLVGWDEILEGTAVEEGSPDGAAPRLSPGAVVSSWRGYAGGIAAARAGHDVVMCPEQQVYLDHRQDAGEDEPVPIGYVRTLRDVYAFDPVPPRLAGTGAAARVIGAQANLWTEVVEDQRRADYQAFPRLAAFAEVVWSEPGARDREGFEGFERRMTAHRARLDALGVAYRPPSGPYPWQRRPGIPGRPFQEPPPAV
ncbi:beta-N-acetylhexosaminidase [Streptomyces sp. DH37]|uniref:beta-N-acetylhexosaminidase n=1 Tax=Streptomyces sp. DH37 TaxID=3040122 RepID=UPI0024428B55|nr:beta-N-acetylhexosaminidase [Streptomyces sp. DH37]MDG9704282.1 beta-N-acetylhexosaminidase [Streptomyces sp. DH37]